METLIWFTVPGAIFGFALIATNPEYVATDASKLLAVVAIPCIGFVLHQLYRVWFEMTRGFRRKSRKVLGHIQNEIAPKCGLKDCTVDKAFLIWEITFYGSEFPSSFRDHDRSAWHYILSFRSAQFAAILGMMWTIYNYFGGTNHILLYKVFGVEAILALGFSLKARYTHDSLVMQELAATFNWNDQFADTCSKLQEMPDARRR